MKKLFAILLAVVLVVALAAPAFAAENGTITITPPSGTAADATNTYKIYKVFDAAGNGTAISYKLVDGKTTAPAGFTVDAAGNVSYTGTGTDGELTAADIAAIAAYVTDTDLVDTVTTTGTVAGTSKSLPNGFYYITSSTGSVVTIDSTNPNATVKDKNTVPGVDKTITGATSLDEDGKKALAQVGTEVEYTAKVTFGKGSKNVVFHDKMGTGLTFKGNDSVTVTGIAADQYTIKATPDAGDTLTITFVDGIAEGTVATIVYKATVNSDALTIDTGKNTASVSYGDENTSNSTPDSETNVYNAKFTVTKKDGNDKALAGAGFVIAKTVEDTAEGAEEGATKTVYYAIANNVVSWVDSIDAATEYTSDAQGAVPAFTGLANGTYTLIEKTVPDGYNKAADSTFTVAEHDYTADNLAQESTVVNNAGSVLPSTGGIGTTIFYVVGGIMVMAAGVLLITKKRLGAEE